MVITAFFVIFILAAVLTKLIKISVKVISKIVLIGGVLILIYFLIQTGENENAFEWIKQLLPQIGGTLITYIGKAIAVIKNCVHSVIQFIEQLISGGVY